MSGDDPFSRCYDTVFALLFNGSNNPLSAMVKPGNRLSFGADSDNDRGPAKERVQSADLPEVRLIDEGGVLNLHATSSTMSYTQNLSIIIQTGDWRYGKFASLLNWYTTCNLKGWRETLAGLKWNGNPYIKNIEANLPIQIGPGNPERTNGIAGWTSVWRLRITMSINSVDVIPFESN
jgi:hypothetical protein